MARIAFDAKREKGQDKDYFKGDFSTPEALVKHLLNITPITLDDTVIDAGSGERKVWFDNLKCKVKIEYEIKDGNNFLEHNEPVDWIVGNPPFWQFIPFIFKSAEISKKGFAFITNHSRINQLTPHRLDLLSEKGFYLSHLHIFGVPKWFGRYYYVIFTKEHSNNITWSNEKFN